MLRRISRQKRRAYVTQRERAYYYFPAVALSRVSDEMFFNSRSYTTSCEREANFISLPRPPLASARRCLRKNQLYPAISIGLHAKMSTLYCYHRHIIHDIGTSHHFLTAGIECAFALTAVVKPIGRQIRARMLVWGRYIEKAFTHRIPSYPGAIRIKIDINRQTRNARRT